MKTPAALARSGPRRRQNSRETILLAAERIFAEAGLAGARTDAIAAAARVNKALLYYYFKSKDDLYEAVLERHFSAFGLRAAEVLARKGPARETLLEFLSMHFDTVSSRARTGKLWPRLMLTGGSVLERLMKKYSLPVKNSLMRLITRGVEDGEFRPVDPGHTVISLLSLTNFYFLMAPLFSKVADVDLYSQSRVAKRKKEILEFVRFGLFRNPEARWP
jgi:TetR/AcrR family transcriptional regulator